MHSIRRWLAVAGLVIMFPMAWQLAAGQVGLLDAGKRSGFLLVGILILGRFLSFGVKQFADTLDGTWEGNASEINEPEDSATSSS